MRTLDVGADKPLPAIPMPAEATRFSAPRDPPSVPADDLFETQLRAILRVATEHPIKVMLPMVATPDEIEATRAVLAQARVKLLVSAPVELGIMVEVPAAALPADVLAERADFFSVGTNDLTQYTMAAERGNDPSPTGCSRPAARRAAAVQATIAARPAHGCWVGVCGELAGDPAAAAAVCGPRGAGAEHGATAVPEVKEASAGGELADAAAAAGARAGRSRRGSGTFARIEPASR